MMKCEECRDLLWDLDCADLSTDLHESLMAHINRCQECASELEEIRGIQSDLCAPSGIDIASRTRSVLNKVYDQIDHEGGEATTVWSWRTFGGFLAAAAIAVFAIVTFSSNETTALTIDNLTNQHRICLIEGHLKNYQCSTETAFAELTMSELGLASRPFVLSTSSFKKGGICQIGGTQVPHALLDVKGETVSYFRLFNTSVKMKTGDNWIKHSKDVWSTKRQGHLVVLRQVDRNDFDFYTGKVELADLEQIWKESPQ